MHTITWDLGYLDPGAIYLFYWYGGSWHPITTTPLPNTDTSYDWTIPETNDPLQKPYVPKSHIQSTSIWIGHWVNGEWECWDSSDKKFKIIDDGWVFNITGTSDKGGATLWFNKDEVSFDGYGVSLNLEAFRIKGTYDIDAKGVISGAYGLSDIGTVPTLLDRALTGSVNANATKMTLKLKDSSGAPLFNLSGVRLLSEPSIPENWTATISGDGKGTFDTFTITPYPDPVNVAEDCAHIFMVSGSEGITPISINGYFFFTPSKTSEGNVIYGIYDPLTIGATSETGTFSGTLKPNPTKGKFNFKAVSDNGNKYRIKGKVAP
jgi:hypothetical protein